MLFFEPNNIKVEKVKIPLKNVPDSFKGKQIVQLSDFHSMWFGNREKKVLRILEEINPDFIFITGDFVDPFTKRVTDRNLKSVSQFWQKLGEKYKNRIFAVLGNHDTDKVKEHLEKAAIKVLDNQNEKLKNGQDFIWLIGVSDPFKGRDNIKKAMEGTDDSVPKILLTHGPELIRKLTTEQIDLMLVGHTHGGLVNAPLLSRIFQPLSTIGRKYKSGLFKIENFFLYVNRGVGTSVFPFRFRCPPEITLIELEKAK